MTLTVILLSLWSLATYFIGLGVGYYIGKKGT